MQNPHNTGSSFQGNRNLALEDNEAGICILTMYGTGASKNSSMSSGKIWKFEQIITNPRYS